MLEQKILDAKAARRKYLLRVGLGVVGISLFCVAVIFFVSTYQFNNAETKVVQEKPAPEKKLATNSNPSLEVPGKQLRQAYIDGLSHYQNNLKPELDKIDLIQWDKARSEQLALLKDNALAAFTAGDYASASDTIKELNQLAKTTIADSQKQFEQALSRAQSSYNEDDYDEAKLQIDRALMLDKAADKATELSTKIDKLPEILPQLEKINTAKAENNLNKELSLIKDLLKLTPERTAAIKRKGILINSIKQRKFNRYMAKSRQALKQGDIQSAKNKISLAERIFPKRQEIADLTLALQNLEKKQRFENHQQKAQMAISSDDWVTAKTELEQTFQAQGNNVEIQKTLALASSIVTLNSEFKQHIKSPYRLSNKSLVSKLQNKISKASALTNHSPSLNKNKETLAGLIKAMNSKIAVQVMSDEQTTILVRGVGIVGKTLSKTIQLLPGKYTFEGKRKGFKSKLIDVLVPYDKSSFRVNIRCDEPI